MDSPLEAIWVRILLKDVKDGDGVTLAIFGCYDRALAEMSKYQNDPSLSACRKNTLYCFVLVATLTTVATTPGEPGELLEH